MQIPLADALSRIKDLLEDDAVLKVGQNLKYDMSVLRQHGIAIRPFDDTMVMSFDLDAGDHGHGMDELSELYLGHKPISYQGSLTERARSQISFADVPVAEATKYAAEDADVTLRLWHHLKLRLSPEKATRVYEMVDRPVVPVLSKWNAKGSRWTARCCRGCPANLPRQIGALEIEIHALAGQPFTIGSPMQLGEILFGKLGHKGGKKGKSGQYSTDVTVLEDLAGQGVEIARKVLDWRQLQKLKSTYTDSAAGRRSIPRPAASTPAIVWSVRRPGGCPRPTPTCRISRSAPKSGGRSAMPLSPNRAMSSCPPTIARSSCVWRRISPTSGRCAKRLQAGEDIHARTAQELFGEVNRDTRGRAKTINFSILYGISRWGLAKRLGVDARGCAGVDRPLFQALPRHPAATSRKRWRACARAAIRRHCSAANAGSRG